MKNIYYNSEGYLSIEGIDTRVLLQKNPTPFYAYSKNEIIGNCRDVHQCAASIELMPCYALKANYNPSLLKIIRDMNFGADVVSGGELHFALNNGIDPQKIVFAGVGKNEEEINLAIQHEIHSINIESKSELELVKTVAQQLKKKIVVAIRVNPDIDAKTHPYISTGLHSSKFGVSREMAIELYNNARKSDYLDPCGVHVHIGSQIEATGPYLETVHFLKNFVSELESMAIDISYLDLGGGIGINYPDMINEQNESTTYIKKILPSLFKPFENEKRKILVELGRSIIGSAGILLTKILYIKETPQKKFIIVDAAMNNLIRPSLYNAYHQILPLNSNEKSTEVVDVVGPVCETADFFAKDRELPVCREGDYLVITGAGAYGQALASNYNLRPTAAEYLIEKDQIHTIFKGESVKDIALKFKS